MRDQYVARGYSLVYTPHVARADLWKTSGHYNFYAENMFKRMELDDAEYQLKPMNCPFHILIYQDRLRSYRDLPVRLGELGTVYRYERSGVMHGLLRVRGFTQDDAHIFCTPGADRRRDRQLPGVRRWTCCAPTASSSTRPSFPPGTAAPAASTTAHPSSGAWARTRSRRPPSG